MCFLWGEVKDDFLTTEAQRTQRNMEFVFRTCLIDLALS